MTMKFYTRQNDLTRYALACGYVQRVGTDEAGAVLEQICSNGALRVMQRGRFGRREMYVGVNLHDARGTLKGCPYHE